MPGWATEGPALLFLQTSPPISHAGLRPGKCYLFLHELTAGEILTFTVCVVVVFGGQEGRLGTCVWFVWGRVRGVLGEARGIFLSFLCSTCSLPSLTDFSLVPVGVPPRALDSGGDGHWL